VDDRPANPIPDNSPESSQEPAAAADQWAGAPVEGALSFSVDDLSNIPTTPGAYLMRDGQGRVLYVGKSVNLRARVRQYFQDIGDQRLNAQIMRRHARRVEVLSTRNEKEALLLELGLIQRLAPRYNLDLRDNKSFFSIRLDHSKKFPRLEFVRTYAARKKGSPPGKGRKGIAREEGTKTEPSGTKRVEFFGPYSSSGAVRRAMGELLKFFPLRSCTDRMLNNRTRPCLLYDVGKCCAPCVLPIAEVDYRELVEGARRLLQGRRQEVLDDLQKQMLAQSEAMEFEAAARTRDRLQALRATLEKQSIAGASMTDRDAIGLVRDGERLLFLVMHYRGGTIAETSRFLQKDVEEEDAELTRQFLAQFYGQPYRVLPREVLVSCEPANAKDLEEIIRTLPRQLGDGTAPPKFSLKWPKRGADKQAIDLVMANAQQILERERAGEKVRDDIAETLQERLGLSRPPSVIECFDISTFQGAATVGVMVRFVDGEPDKSHYRKFKLTAGAGAPDDFASMREVLHRRYKRLLEEGQPLPDLLLVDGGQAQLAQAELIVKELGIEGMGLAAIAKSRDKTPRIGDERAPSDASVKTDERIFLPGRKNYVNFARQSAALLYMQRIRDETHRFAVTFHRVVRRNKTLTSALRDIPGIGPKRARTLLKNFGSIEKIRAASVDELHIIGGLGLATAQAAWQALHADNKPLSNEPLS